MGDSRKELLKLDLQELIPKQSRPTTSCFRKTIRVLCALTLCFIVGILVIKSDTSRRASVYFTPDVKGVTGSPDRWNIADQIWGGTSVKETSDGFGSELEAWIPDWYNQTDIGLVLRKRRQSVLSVCEKKKALVDEGMKHAYEGVYHLGHDGRIGFSQHNQLGICYTPKAGSSYWQELVKTISLRGGAVTSRHRPYGLTTVDKYFTRTEHQVIQGKSWTTITIVRNPWHRFVSVYIQKQVSAGRERTKFLRNCRNIVTPRDRVKLSFEEFLICAVHQMEDNVFNRHWEPVYRRCDICNRPFTAFIALENMKAESDFILKRVGITHSVKIMEKVRENTIRSVEVKRLSENYTDYYRNLKHPDLIRRFAKFYELDFEMFGYPDSPFAVMEEDS